MNEDQAHMDGTEFEIKLEVPLERLAAVLADVSAGDTTTQALHSRYYDTPDGDLAAHGIGLRLRCEDGVWVQTSKGRGSGPVDRLEHNAVVGPGSTDEVPPLHLERHAGTTVGDRIAAALKISPLQGAASLATTFHTRVERRMRLIERDGSRIELALDQGELVAGDRRNALCELEFELKAGDAQAAVDEARAWCARHGLWLSVVSKAAKGRRLADDQAAGPAVGARQPALQRSMDGATMTRTVIAACLEQILGNASEVASGHGSADHVHQLRVGIRRLRTALRELDGIGAPFDATWEPALVDAFRALGRHRDHSHLAHEVEPVLHAAGAPPVDVAGAAEDMPDPVETVRASAFQDTLLGLLAYAHGGAREAQGVELGPRAARKAIRTRLKKLHARVLKDGEHFTALDEAAQHRVRKRCKRLRYLLEFTAPLMQARRLDAFLDGLKPVQTALGTYNDELVALAAYRERAATEQAAWFGVGWLTARRPANAAACLAALQRFAQLPAPWK